LYWSLDRRADPVQVVLAHEEDRELPDRGHVQRLVERPLVVGRVAEEADRDRVAALHLERHGEAGGQRERTADERVPAHEVTLCVEDVHRAAEAARAAGRLAVQLGHHLLGRDSTHERVDVVPVPGDDVVVARTGRGHDPVGARFLSWIEMEEATDLADLVVLVALLFEAAGEEHVAEQPFAKLGVHGKSSVLSECRRVARPRGDAKECRAGYARHLRSPSCPG
jgi:hypothetical protein